MRTFHPFCYSHFTILFYGYIYNWQRDVKLHTKKLKTFAKKQAHDSPFATAYQCAGADRLAKAAEISSINGLGSASAGKSRRMLCIMLG